MTYEEIRKRFYDDDQWYLERLPELEILGYITSKQRDFVEKAIPILNKVYPQRWDLKLEFPNINDMRSEIANSVGISGDMSKYRISYAKRKFIRPKIKLIIHYPVMKISNGVITHTMTNLFCSVKINERPINSEDTRIFLEEVSAMRTSISIKEYRATYIFSHVPHQSFSSCPNNPDRFFLCCLGSGEINNLLSIFNAHNEMVRFTHILLQLETYFGWESLEGVPYARISEIIKPRDPLLSVRTRQLEILMYYVLEAISLNNDLPRIHIRFTNGRYEVVDDILFDKFLLKIQEIYAGRNSEFYDNSFLCVQDYAGEFYELNSVNLSMPSIPDGYYTFRGVPYKYTVYNDDEEINQPKTVVKPQIKRYVKSKLESKINQTFITGYINGLLYSSSNS